MRLVIPTVFAVSKEAFEHRFNSLTQVSKNVQIDFMDGKFVDNKSVGIKDVPKLDRKINFEAHLMVKNPADWLADLKKLGFKKVIFHFESCKDNWEVERVIDESRKMKFETFIAVNPETPVIKIIPFVYSLSGVLFMGVHPGKEHQNFIHDVYKKIKELRFFNKKILIQVDGGVNLETAEKLADLGVDIINVGSFVGSSDNPEKALRKLEMAFL